MPSANSVNENKDGDVNMDMVKELRLRSWARQNYVLPAQRSEKWHSTVLDEMERRDVEILALREKTEDWDKADFGIESEVGPDSIVPLMPTGIAGIHKAHREVPAPKFMSRTAPVYDELACSGWF